MFKTVMQLFFRLHDLKGQYEDGLISAGDFRALMVDAILQYQPDDV